MKTFTAFEYLLINAANAFDKDKLLFEERIQWATEHYTQLAVLAPKQDDSLKAIKATQVLYQAAATSLTDAVVYLDASCSGIQIMSAMLNCYKGAYNTGLINPDLRADLYTTGQQVMNNLLEGRVVLSIPRKFLKDAIMTCGYGSTKQPKDLFEPLGVLNEFYQAMDVCAPSAFKLMKVLLHSWNATSDVHSWVLPDGFQAIIPVTEKLEKRIEIAELGNASVTVGYEDYAIKEKGLSNVANAIHSVDAFVLRNMLRRCNYDPYTLNQALESIQAALELPDTEEPTTSAMEIKLRLVAMHNFIDPTWFDFLTTHDPIEVPKDILRKLLDLGNRMLAHPPFELTTIHDAFGSHATNCNRVRYWYKEILAELAESTIINSILIQLGQAPLPGVDHCIADAIRESNYSIG